MAKNTIEMPASIVKHDIPACGALKGTVNGDAIRIGAVSFPAYTLRYLGFAGGLVMDVGRYVGVHRFAILSAPRRGEPSFDALPGVAGEDVDDAI